MDTIGCVWTGEFDLNTLRLDPERKSCGFKNIRIRVDGALVQRPLDLEALFSFNSRAVNSSRHKLPLICLPFCGFISQQIHDYTIEMSKSNQSVHGF